eukprot:TRINITY_DN30754_c0_g1_i1.p1 TRINITY_DN30754_c0_g1~~TRINITY_DN30754_c0_g1_i1.p1  ORF type:complete len:325 (-),score=28.11 TRINITY_DN30754_c0_g1_i1:474-1448(-)
MTLPADLLVYQAYTTAFRQISDASNQHFQGLQVAARWAKKNRKVTEQMYKRLVALDSAFQVCRHISAASARQLQDELGSALSTPLATPCVSPTGGATALDASGDVSPPYSCPLVCARVAGECVELQCDDEYYGVACTDTQTQTDPEKLGLANALQCCASSTSDTLLAKIEYYEAKVEGLTSAPEMVDSASQASPSLRNACSSTMSTTTTVEPSQTIADMLASSSHHEAMELHDFEGVFVRISNVQKKPALNDKIGEIEKSLIGGRFAVKMLETSTTISFSAANLIQVDDPNLQICTVCCVGDATDIRYDCPYCGAHPRARVLAG